MVEELGQRRVVVVGEIHNVREHHEFVAQLIPALHEHGLRLVLLEGFHADSWLVDQYVMGTIDSLPPVPRQAFGGLLSDIRTFNAAQQPSERIHVAFVDINHRAQAFASALASMYHQGVRVPGAEAFFEAIDIDDALAVDPFDYEVVEDKVKAFVTNAPEEYRHQLEVLSDTLQAAAGKTHAEVDLVAEMAEIALESLEIRAVWERDGEDAAHPIREEIIKRVVERRLQSNPNHTLINIGGFHAQREHVMGTPKVWLGEYLAKESPSAKGSVFTLFVVAARGDRSDGRGGTEPFDNTATDDEHDFIARVHEFAGDHIAFVPLRDPYFHNEKLEVDYGGLVVRHSPARQFDALLLLPWAHPL